MLQTTCTVVLAERSVQLSAPSPGNSMRVRLRSGWDTIVLFTFHDRPLDTTRYWFVVGARLGKLLPILRITCVPIAKFRCRVCDTITLTVALIATSRTLLSFPDLVFVRFGHLTLR